MKDNPYSPPKAVVDDVSALEPAGERPREITLVVQLAVISFVLGIIAMLLAWDFYRQLQSVAATVSGQVFSLVLMGWIYIKIWQGRNWARITWLVFAIIGLGMMVFTYPMISASLPAVSKAQMVVGTGISFVQFWLLYFSAGKRWFGRGQTKT
jgi:hypothetical protein